MATDLIERGLERLIFNVLAATREIPIHGGR